MATTSPPPAELFEPDKFDPLDFEQRKKREEAFIQYKNIAGSNPFGARPSFRDGLKERECRRPAPEKLDTDDYMTHQHVYIVEHPALRNKPSYSSHDITTHDNLEKEVFGLLNSPSDPTTLYANGHRRNNTTDTGYRVATTIGPPNHLPTKSASDTNVLRPAASRNVTTSANGSPQQRKRKVSPLPLSNLLRSPTKSALNPISEIDSLDLNNISSAAELARNYKVEVPDASGEKVLRSPLKKLFGDRGILGKTTSSKDLTGDLKKPSIANFGNKLKARVDDLADRMQQIELSPQKRAAAGLGLGLLSRSTATAQGPSKFPVSLSPYVQGDFYMQLELLLNITTNNFLQQELACGRVSPVSVKTISAQWAAKGRPQVLGFRYDLATQRELVGLNTETLHFSGINAFSRTRLLGVMAAWKVLAREVAVRTFCQPDSAVKKHLHDVEGVLVVVGAGDDEMCAFREMRERVLMEIRKEERREEERRRLYNGVERNWSPSKAYRERF